MRAVLWQRVPMNRDKERLRLGKRNVRHIGWSSHPKGCLARANGYPQAVSSLLRETSSSTCVRRALSLDSVARPP